MGEGRPYVLVVEDDAVQRAGIVRLVAALGYAAVGAADGSEALDLVHHHQVAVAIIDLELPGMHGLDVLRSVKATRDIVECVILTGAGSADLGVEARAQGASDYFEKPIVDMARFQQVIRRAFEVFHLRRTIDMLGSGETTRVFGDSQAIRDVFAQADRVAGSAAPVLITGEAGVGKQQVADVIHARGAGKGQFVRLHCGAFPAAHVEVELFGVEQGANGPREGLLALASHGSLYLDDVAALPMEVQATLASALERLSYRAVGGSTDRELTARIIAAAEDDLTGANASARLHPALLERLSVLVIAVPPLRQRKEDIAVLLRHFLKKYSALEGRDVPHLPEAVLDKLVASPWPGNVRQLAAATRAAVTVAHGRSLRIDDFGLANPSVRTENQPPPGPEDDERWTEYIGLPLSDAKAAVERDFVVVYLRDKLRRTSGNISRAAVLAGVLRPNFKREMRRFKVQVADRA